MDTEAQVDAYLASQPDGKRADLQDLHDFARRTAPNALLWFLDGRNEDGKIVSNPNIGYGVSTIRYADGTTKEFYRVGLSANTAGISVYVMGIEDKGYLAATFGARIGKADVTAYCIRFKRIADVDLEALHSAIRFGLDPNRPTR